MEKKIVSFMELVDPWKKSLDYSLLENDDLKSLLKILDLDTYRHCPGMNLATLILSASIHHGIKTKEISQIASEILPDLQRIAKVASGAGAYVTMLINLLLKRPLYRRVTARIFLALQYANPKDLAREASLCKMHEARLIKIAQGKPIEAVLDYANFLEHEEHDEKGAGLVKAVLKEFE